MDAQNQPIEALRDIRQYMDRSSRFVGLSGWSGVAAGSCALVAAWFVGSVMGCWKRGACEYNEVITDGGADLQATLIRVAAITFISAFLLAFLFTWLRSRKTGVPVWGYTARKLMINVAVPLIAGGLLIIRMTEFGNYGLVAPSCLIFYGLALINGSKYTLVEVRYMGYVELLLGFANLWLIGYGLYFWAIGFGVVHILYGIIMWYKYERKS